MLSFHLFFRFGFTGILCSIASFFSSSTLAYEQRHLAPPVQALMVKNHSLLATTIQVGKMVHDAFLPILGMTTLLFLSTLLHIKSGRSCFLKESYPQPFVFFTTLEQYNQVTRRFSKKHIPLSSLKKGRDDKKQSSLKVKQTSFYNTLKLMLLNDRLTSQGLTTELLHYHRQKIFLYRLPGFALFHALGPFFMGYRGPLYPPALCIALLYQWLFYSHSFAKPDHSLALLWQQLDPKEQKQLRPLFYEQKTFLFIYYLCIALVFFVSLYWFFLWIHTGKWISLFYPYQLLVEKYNNVYGYLGVFVIDFIVRIPLSKMPSKLFRWLIALIHHTTLKRSMIYIQALLTTLYLLFHLFVEQMIYYFLCTCLVKEEKAL